MKKRKSFLMKSKVDLSILIRMERYLRSMLDLSIRLQLENTVYET